MLRRPRVGKRRLVKYPSDPRHWQERRVLAPPDVEEAAQTARSGMVAVLTLDWDTCLMTGSEGALNDGLPMIGASGAIHDVLESDGVETYRFHSARGESHVSKLQKRRTLGRKLLTEFTVGEVATTPRQRPQLGRPDLFQLLRARVRPRTLPLTVCGF